MALRMYYKFEEAEAAVMSDKISSDAGMMIEWNCPWIVKGVRLRLPADQQSRAFLAMELMAKGSIEKCVSTLTPEQKVLALLFYFALWD
jgi:hypothetical protein